MFLTLTAQAQAQTPKAGAAESEAPETAPAEDQAQAAPTEDAAHAAPAAEPTADAAAAEAAAPVATDTGNSSDAEGAAHAQAQTSVDDAGHDEPEDDASEDADADADADADDDDESSGHPGGHPGGLQLPGDLRLHGIFDLAYERIGYTDDPGDGRDSLRNYHHFLFLQREARGDPFSIKIELVDLTFYEIGIQLTERDAPWALRIELGKLLVPFGDEPLFHHSYGGVRGFDQRMLPAVWARHGAALKLQRRVGDVDLQNDLYLVQGHAIAQADAVIDLQSDLSPTDDIRLAVGDRIGLSWDALSAWYSIYYNRIGFGRQLLVQAVDLGLYRFADVPVLEDFAIAAGVIRANVFGGENDADNDAEDSPLEDYYHFGDYLRLRYYATHWLHFEARSGIVTRDNRKALVRDRERDDVKDVTTHSLGAFVQFGGFTVSLQHFWRLEERDEIDDDFLRLRFSYAF